MKRNKKSEIDSMLIVSNPIGQGCTNNNCTNTQQKKRFPLLGIVFLLGIGLVVTSPIIWKHPAFWGKRMVVPKLFARKTMITFISVAFMLLFKFFSTFNAMLIW